MYQGNTFALLVSIFSHCQMFLWFLILHDGSSITNILWRLIPDPEILGIEIVF